MTNDKLETTGGTSMNIALQETTEETSTTKDQWETTEETSMAIARQGAI